MRIDIRRPLVAIAIVSVGAAAAAVQSPAAEAPIEKIFGRWTTTTPGCAVGVARKDAPVIRAAYGMADLEHDVPNTPDSIFEAGSVSKQFTAAAVLLLARDGKLALDDQVRQYIPELPDYGTSVTVRQMLQHTAGLRDWGALAGIAGWPRTTRVHTHAHVLDIVSRQRALNFTPGTRWSYSNSGYNLAAVLVSRLSGMPFAEFTRTRIFEPLGMKDTSWRDDHTRVVKRRAIAYAERQGTFVTDMPFENVHGNGGLLTTVGDLLKWNENFRTHQVGDAAFVADMERRATFTDGRPYEYALGLYVDTYKGVREVDHSGATAGYRAHLSRYPEQQLSIAVLCNAGSANPTAYAKAIADLYLTGLQPLTPPAATHTLTSAEAAGVVGLYRSVLPAATATVVYDQTSLQMRGIGTLIPLSAARFVTADRYTVEFTDEFGTVDRFDRVEPVTPSADQLKEFAGRYVSDEIETVLGVAVEGDRLVVKRRPDATMPLTPVYADAFTGPLGWVRFHRSAAGRIEALSVSQDRVWDLRFTRRAESAPTSASR